MSGGNKSAFPMPTTIAASDIMPPNVSIHTEFEWDPWITVEIGYLCFICTAGTFGNLMVIAAVILYPSLRTVPNILIVLLAVIDFINTSILVPFFILSLHNRRWPYRPESCAFLAYLTILCLGMSVTTLGLIAGNRYVNIAHSKLVYYNRCKPTFVGLAVGMCLLIELPAVVIPPHIGFGQVGFNWKIRHCSLVYDTHNDWLYPFGLFVSCVFVVAAIIPIFYCLTFRAVHKSSRKVGISRTITGNNLAKNSNLNLNRHFSREDFRLTSKLALIFTMYLACWMPYCITVLLDSEGDIPAVIHRVTNLGVWTMSCVNPYLYAWMIRSFRVSYRRILYCDHQCAVNCCKTKPDSNEFEQDVSNISRHFQFVSCVSSSTSSAFE